AGRVGPHAAIARAGALGRLLVAALLGNRRAGRPGALGTAAAVVVRPPRRSRRGVRAVALVLVAAGLDDFAGPTAQRLAVGVGSPFTSDRALPGDRDHIGGPDRAARGPHPQARLIGRRPAPRTGHGTPRRAGPAARPRDRVAGCRNGGAPGRVPWPDV